MNDTDHPTMGGDRVAFVASEPLVAALDRAAAQRGETRSHFARRLIAEHLRAAGLLDLDTPTTVHDAQRRARAGAGAGAAR